jgi:hypothetical protein
LFDKLQFVGSNGKLKLVGQKHLFYWDRGRPARILITAARSASNQSPDESEVLGATSNVERMKSEPEAVATG